MDSIDFDDVCKVVVALLDCGRLQELRWLIEELTRESSSMNLHHPARRVVLLRTFCDFLALERADLGAAARCAERSPELADVQLAGLCVKCISWCSRIFSLHLGRDISSVSGDIRNNLPARGLQGERLAECVAVSDIFNNLSLFSDVVRLLNNYTYLTDESSEESRSMRGGDDDPAERYSSAVTGDLSKREISNLLNQLGLAFQSVVQNSTSSVSVHLQALFAAYQHGLGQHGEVNRHVNI